MVGNGKSDWKIRSVENRIRSVQVGGRVITRTKVDQAREFQAETFLPNDFSLARWVARSEYRLEYTVIVMVGVWE